MERVNSTHVAKQEQYANEFRRLTRLICSGYTTDEAVMHLEFLKAKFEDIVSKIPPTDSHQAGMLQKKTE